jgi:hypothetical protein
MLYKTTDLSGITTRAFDIFAIIGVVIIVALDPGPRKYLNPSAVDNADSMRTSLENISTVGL